MCVCVWGGGGCGAGGKPENIPRTQAASPQQMLKEGGKQMLHSPAPEYSHAFNLIVTQGEVTRYQAD